MTTIITPVLLIIFNRPDTTEAVFKQIRKVQPRQLFIAGDGPRPGVPGEQEKCEKARSIVAQVDWPCQVHTLFRDRNHGCRDGVSSAIHWFFSHVEEGIILEDDCLPDPSFFSFCEELLIKYRHNAEVAHIGGTAIPGIEAFQQDGASYFFSKYTFIWGWATWRRAWQRYHVDVPELGEFKNKKSHPVFKNEEESKFWIHNFEKSAAGLNNTWDYQWYFTVWNQNGKAILPYKNLISNIGFRQDATHTTSSDNELANLKTSPIKSIIHPSEIKVNQQADQFIYLQLFKPVRISFFSKVKNKIGNIFK